jgi:hypothetical protein
MCEVRRETVTRDKWRLTENETQNKIDERQETGDNKLETRGKKNEEKGDRREEKWEKQEKERWLYDVKPHMCMHLYCRVAENKNKQFLPEKNDLLVKRVEEWQ